MFGGKNRNSKPYRIESIIGSDLTIEGNVAGGGAIRIDGGIKGGVSLTGDVYVGEAGKVDGDVRVNNIMVAGEITGSVHAAGRLEIERTGRMAGGINAFRLVVAEGAQFRGYCLVGEPATEAHPVPGEAAEGLLPAAPVPDRGPGQFLSIKSRGLRMLSRLPLINPKS